MLRTEHTHQRRGEVQHGSNETPTRQPARDQPGLVKEKVDDQRANAENNSQNLTKPVNRAD